MPSVFTKIMQGELPAHVVFQDDLCMAFLSIDPLQPGHTLVVPRKEIEHWLNLPESLACHLVNVSKKIGKAIEANFPCRRIGLVIAGLEVPHVHLHVVPIQEATDLSFDLVRSKPASEDLHKNAERLRKTLQTSNS